MNRILATLSVLCLTLTSAAFALPTNKFYTGFEVGVGNETLLYSNSYNFIGSAYPMSVNYLTPFNYSLSSYIYTGGLMFGYAKSINKHVDVDYEFSVMGNSGPLSSTDQMQSPFTYTPAALQQYTAKTQLNISYGFDLAVKPAFKVTREFNTYLKAGVANAELISSLNIYHNNALTSNVYNSTGGATRNNVWGYVLGAGFEYALSAKCSIFGEYNFHQYQASELKTVTITDNGSGALPGESVTNTITYTRKVSPYLNTFNIGLHYYFIR